MVGQLREGQYSSRLEKRVIVGGGGEEVSWVRLS
jgi:hypothetical protein